MDCRMQINDFGFMIWQPFDDFILHPKKPTQVEFLHTQAGDRMDSTRL